MKKSTRKNLNMKCLLMAVLLVCAQMANTQNTDSSLQTGHQSKTDELGSEGGWTLTKLKAPESPTTPNTAQRRLLACGLDGRVSSNCTQTCSANCLDCSSTAANTCSSCVYGYYLTGGNTCSTTCGTLPTDCLSCGGNANNNCVLCKAGYSLRDHY